MKESLANGGHFQLFHPLNVKKEIMIDIESLYFYFDNLEKHKKMRNKSLSCHLKF